MALTPISCAARVPATEENNDGRRLLHRIGPQRDDEVIRRLPVELLHLGASGERGGELLRVFFMSWRREHHALLARLLRRTHRQYREPRLRQRGRDLLGSLELRGVYGDRDSGVSVGADDELVRPGVAHRMPRVV